LLPCASGRKAWFRIGLSLNYCRPNAGMRLDRTRPFSSKTKDGDSKPRRLAIDAPPLPLYLTLETCVPDRGGFREKWDDRWRSIASTVA
jgi:hypothetical protein